MLVRTLTNLFHAGPLLREATAQGNAKVLASMLGPAWRGLVKQEAHGAAGSPMAAAHRAWFDWTYARRQPELAKLYEAAKRAQWNATSDLDWTISVDPGDPTRPLVPDGFVPVSEHPVWNTLSAAERGMTRFRLVAWLLSQFLHGEQGALFAAAQVVEAVPWMDAKLYGSTQVVDEGRHVEVFHRYLSEKLGKVYEINDNLYVIVDALMTDGRWDVKFLGMQILIEGLALGAFGLLRQLTAEPLLRKLLSYVIADEARHVHYGVLALQETFTQLSERERRDREDWTLEICMLLRNRFLAHEFYEEHFAHAMSRAEWDALVARSQLMGLFRQTMFKRIIPNLKRIGLLSPRIRPRYEALGLLGFEHLPAAPELTARDLLEESAGQPHG